MAGQLSEIQDEIFKLKVDKLESLRQNVAAATLNFLKQGNELSETEP